MNNSVDSNKYTQFFFVCFQVVVPDLPSSYCMNARPLGVDPGPALLYEVLGTTLLAWSLCGLIDARRHGSIKHLGIKFVVVVLALLMNVVSCISLKLTLGTRYEG